MSDDKLPIETLIRNRCEELGLRSVELIRRCGYQNTNKGLRRLEQLCQGSFSSSAKLNRALPSALDVPVEVVKKAIEESQHRIHEAEKAAWRAEFVPHAIIMTERQFPEPMFVAAFLSIDRLRRVELDLTKSPMTYIKQALDGLGQKLARWDTDQIPTFGRPESVVINYSPDHAVRFDLEGNAVEALDRAHRIGDVNLSIGKRPVSSRELEAIFFGR